MLARALAMVVLLLAPAASAERPVAFGYKCAWLAVRGVAAEKVASALLAPGARRAGWSAGLKAAYESEIFVSPSLDGWVLVVGVSLPDAGGGGHPDRITPFLLRWSRTLATVVQYFGTHRVVEYHAWAMADRGKLIRAYAYLGEEGVTLVDSGAKTSAEQKLAFEFPDEETVMKIAGGWSLDPTTLDARKGDTGAGFIGKLAR